jgi:alkyl sulfatase BDS1-like metallo-beta-lactamase superfamily hydrolase
VKLTSGSPAAAPDSYPADFDDPQRGFIAEVPDGEVLGDGGRVVLSLKKTHGFEQQTTTPATVNPSLWRQTRLNGFQGLFKVVDRVYQIRGLGDSSMTIVESDTGVIVVDTLIATETAKAGMDLYFQHRPRKSVVAVIYTHSHADHISGVRGVVTEDDVPTGKVAIVARSCWRCSTTSRWASPSSSPGRRRASVRGPLKRQRPFNFLISSRRCGFSRAISWAIFSKPV